MYYQLILTEVNDRNETINALIGAARLSASEAIYAIDNIPSFITNMDNLKEAEELKTNIERSKAIIDIVQIEETYRVTISSYNTANKIDVIKGVRNVLDLGLAESKQLIERCPVVVAKGLSKQEAEKMTNELSAIEAYSICEKE